MKNIVADYCKQILDTLTFQPPDDIITNERILFNILPIINGLYEYNYISLRSIRNIVNINFKSPKSPNIEGVGFSFRKYHIAYQLNILKFLCGDLDSLLDGLKTLKSEKYSIEGFESSAKNVLYFNTAYIHKFNYSTLNLDRMQHSYNCENFHPIIITYAITNNSVQINCSKDSITLEYYYAMLLEACIKLKIGNGFN